MFRIRRSIGIDHPGSLIMGLGAQVLSTEQWMRLDASYKQHGSGPEFWEAYRDILDTVSQQGDGAAAANELARLAVQLGVTETALFV
ncbi:MAG: hypothetical protein DI584_10625 [Stenotrophomonas sp.]|uniref:hypothetical protein n=1 Tax=Stenotrophomonas sp. TaxID=69392 RepID=UPI000DAF69F7|nr:hypothetical protein [Stenotrophomonas sp.]PZU26896.1 MAG: hypothetical protein DI584_10625 [Stenotrophomonas sp.]